MAKKKPKKVAEESVELPKLLGITNVTGTKVVLDLTDANLGIITIAPRGKVYLPYNGSVMDSLKKYKHLTRIK